MSIILTLIRLQNKQPDFDWDTYDGTIGFKTNFKKGQIFLTIAFHETNRKVLKAIDDFLSYHTLKDGDDTYFFNNKNIELYNLYNDSKVENFIFNNIIPHFIGHISMQPLETYELKRYYESIWQSGEWSKSNFCKECLSIEYSELCESNNQEKSKKEIPIEIKPQNENKDVLMPIMQSLGRQSLFDWTIYDSKVYIRRKYLENGNLIVWILFRKMDNQTRGIIKKFILDYINNKDTVHIYNAYLDYNVRDLSFDIFSHDLDDTNKHHLRLCQSSADYMAKHEESQANFMELCEVNDVYELCKAHLFPSCDNREPITHQLSKTQKNPAQNTIDIIKQITFKDSRVNDHDSILGRSKGLTLYLCCNEAKDNDIPYHARDKEDDDIPYIVFTHNDKSTTDEDWDDILRSLVHYYSHDLFDKELIENDVKQILLDLRKKEKEPEVFCQINIENSKLSDDDILVIWNDGLQVYYRTNYRIHYFVKARDDGFVDIDEWNDMLQFMQLHYKSRFNENLFTDQMNCIISNVKTALIHRKQHPKQEVKQEKPILKIFHSMPLDGRNHDEIKTQLKIEHKLIYAKYGDKFDVQILDTLIRDKSPEKVKNKSLWYFGVGLYKYLSNADLLVLGQGWERARGCIAEKFVAEQYGIDIDIL